MVTVTLTAHVKDTITAATHDTFFSTTSTTYVDTTGYNMSVENNFFWSIHGNPDKASSAGGTWNWKLVEGATDEAPVKSIATNSATAVSFWMPQAQNTQGSTQTVKVQQHATTASWAGEYNLGHVLYKADASNFIDGTLGVPIANQTFIIDGKMDLATVTFRPFSANTDAASRAGTTIVTFGAERAFFGVTEGVSFNSQEQNPDGMYNATINNIMNQFRYFVINGVTAKTNLVADWDGDQITIS